jgi:predicted DsbA family dithiol-disulfide isomerase
MNTKTSPLRIDVVSDVVCPWCAIGLASLQEALRRLGGDVPVSLHIQPFELNPQMPPEGEDIVDHLSRKYGISAEQIDQNRQAIAARGAALGFTFGPRARIWNTFDAHRLLHWAGLTGADRQLALKNALLQAYHGQGENVSEVEVLVQAVRDAGLDEARAREVLAGGEFADDVRESEHRWQQAGIRSVPAVILDGRYLVSGGQPPEVFEQALRQVLAEPQTPAG